MNFFSSLVNKIFFKEKEDIRKLRRSLKGKSYKKMIRTIASDYLSKSVEDRIMSKYELEIYTEDVNKLSLLSLAFVFLTPLISKIFDGMWLIGLCLCLYFFVAIFITKLISKFKFCKLYLMTIEDIHKGRIKNGIVSRIDINFKDDLDVPPDQENIQGSVPINTQENDDEEE